MSFLLFRLLPCITWLMAWCGFLLLKPIDRTPWQQCTFFKQQQRALQQSPWMHAADAPLLASWASCSLVPPFTTPVAIDADRGGKHWKTVHDTVSVRVIVLHQGNMAVAIISCELLIVPPLVVTRVNELLQKKGMGDYHLYFSATHAHSSIGAWHPSRIGELFAGKFDARVPEFFAHQIVHAITSAQNQLDTAAVAYSSIPTTGLVYNRLVGYQGETDSLLRVLWIRKNNGATAALASFAAHATCLHQGTMEVSGDWPSAWVRDVQRKKLVDFPFFMAGGVGSMGPAIHLGNKWETVDAMASGVATAFEKIFAQPHHWQSKGLAFRKFPLHMREPNLRANHHFALRTKWFNTFFGKADIAMTLLAIGPVKLIGMPCDFSGELTDDIASGYDAPVMITSFNGGYIGYITKDCHYEMDAYETKTMGWFGPQNGDYLVHLARWSLKGY
ncbi:MAG: hypothetical protein U0T84_01730 [Chitinophagales bacterium]